MDDISLEKFIKSYIDFEQQLRKVNEVMSNGDSTREFVQGFASAMAGREAGKTGYSNPNFSLQGLIEASQQGPEYFEKWVEENAPAPCPAVVAIMRFSLGEGMEFMYNGFSAGLDSGDIQSAMKAVQVGVVLSKAIEIVNSAPHAKDVPDLTFETIHDLISLYDPAYLCDAVRAELEGLGINYAEMQHTVASYVTQLQEAHKTAVETVTAAQREGGFPSR